MTFSAYTDLDVARGTPVTRDGVVVGEVQSCKKHKWMSLVSMVITDMSALRAIMAGKSNEFSVGSRGSRDAV